MYSPCLVLPYMASFSQWYTLESVFTQTLPAPPPVAASRCAAGVVAFEDAAALLDAALLAAAGDGAAAGVEAVWDFAGAEAAAFVSGFGAFVSYQVFTPL